MPLGKLRLLEIILGEQHRTRRRLGA